MASRKSINLLILLSMPLHHKFEVNEKLGLDCDTKDPPPLSGTKLLDRLSGTKLSLLASGRKLSLRLRRKLLSCSQSHKLGQFTDLRLLIGCSLLCSQSEARSVS